MRIGLSTCGKNITEDLFRAYWNSGIDCMEISTAYDQYQALDYPALKAWSAAYCITLHSFHLPFGPFEELDISRPELQEQSIAYLSSLIAKAADIGIRLFVVHPSGEPIAEADRPARLRCAKDSLARLADFAAGYGAVIAVENLPRTCLGRDSADILELVSAHPALKVCFDTNHLLEEDSTDFIRKTGKFLVSTHVSDYDFRNERHWLPGEGKLDWKTLYAALEVSEYTGPWLYELGFAAPASICRPRDLICEDFAENAKCIFSGKPLPVLGIPKADLHAWK